MNNTVVNLVHVVGTGGVDELQVVRISIAQTLSFVIVLVLFFATKAWRKPTFREPGWLKE
ncbi:hypothetical protein [Gulosibacter molinativorax]|uniref:hypothetical protein n=1 Tax=Gulosibacter molinativorax TaxID=256821 RepID=UPI0012ECB289|nr:hypothetical protein [Gulosibacter molinativorax]